jgi:hypothetical protein
VAGADYGIFGAQGALSRSDTNAPPGRAEKAR